MLILGILQAFLGFLILQLNITSSKSQTRETVMLKRLTVTTTPHYSNLQYTLDLSSHLTYPWHLSDYSNENRTHWFDYFKNLEENSLSTYARTYFATHNISLLPFNSVEGVWVAFDPQYDCRIDLPVIGFSTSSSVIQNVEISFYIHGTASIRVKFGADFLLEEIYSDSKLEWVSKSWSVEDIQSVELEIHASKEEGFVFIDKIIVEALDLTSSTTHPWTETTETVTSEETVPTTTVKPRETLILDLKTDTFISWHVSTTEYEDWFYYYDSLDNLTDAASLYFGDLDLESLKAEKGVWVAFNSPIGPPIFDLPYPIIKLDHTFKTYDILEITYCTYGNASIRIYFGNEEIIELHSDASLTWTTYSVSLLNPNSFEIELVADYTDGDFVLIDKVIAISHSGPRMRTLHNFHISTETTPITITETTSSEPTTIQCFEPTLPDESSIGSISTDASHSTEVISSSTEKLSSTILPTLSTSNTNMTSTLEFNSTMTSEVPEETSSSVRISSSTESESSGGSLLVPFAKLFVISLISMIFRIE